MTLILPRRARARKQRQLLADGIDPMHDRDEKRRALRGEAPGREAVQGCGACLHGIAPCGLEESEACGAVGEQMENYVFPKLGDMPVSDIDVRMCCESLNPCGPEN